LIVAGDRSSPLRACDGIYGLATGGRAQLAPTDLQRIFRAADEDCRGGLCPPGPFTIFCRTDDRIAIYWMLVGGRPQVAPTGLQRGCAVMTAIAGAVFARPDLLRYFVVPMTASPFIGCPPAGDRRSPLRAHIGILQVATTNLERRGNVKKSIFILSFIMICSLLFMPGCSSNKEPNPPVLQEIKLINPMGPTVIPVAGIHSGTIGEDINLDIQYWNTIDEAIGLLSSGAAQFAVLPITNGANIYASGIDIVLLGVHEWKVFYLLASDKADFEGWSSLEGQTVYTPTARGQTVDIITRYALSQENIKPDEEVNFAYAPPQEIVALFKEGKIDYAALPEPFVSLTLASAGGKVVLDYQDYWCQISGSQLGIPIAGLFVQKDFLEMYPQEAQKVADLFAESTTWANENPDLAVQASSEILPLPAPVMQSALQRIKFDYIPAAESEKEVKQFLEIMQENYPEGVKKIPDTGFFVK
jgi:NitT/TauT family transport system substrate-binding protein